MNNLQDDAFAIKDSALLKALENTTVHCFSCDIIRGTIAIPRRTCERFGCKPIYDNMPFSFSDEFVCDKDKPGFNKMYADIKRGADTAEVLFRNKAKNSWYHVTLTVTERGGDKAALRAVGIIEDLSVAKRREIRYSKWIDALGGMYFVRCYINLDAGTYMLIENSGDELMLPIPEEGKTDSLIDFYCEKYIHPDDREDFKTKTSADNIRSRLDSKNRSFSLEYRQSDEKGCPHRVRGTVTAADIDSGGLVQSVVFTAQYIDEEAEERAIHESSLSLMRKTYYRIACIDLNGNSMRTISISKSERSGVQAFKDDFKSAIKAFANDFVLDEYRDNFLNIMLPERMRDIFDAGTDYVDLTYRRLESGVPKWVRSELIPLQGYSPESRRVMWYVKNISVEKAAEERLTQKLLKINADVNLRLETILDGISGGFKISSDDERLTYSYISENAAKLFGYTPDELARVTGNSAEGLVYPPDLEQALKDLQSDLKKGGSYSVKYRVKCKDGSIKWIVDSGKRVMYEDGKAMFYSLYHDVTPLEERNAELRDALTMFNQMIRSLSCGVLAYRLPVRKIIAFNDEAKRIFDVENECDSFNMNKTTQEKIYPEDAAAFMNAVKQIKNPGDSVTYQFRIRHRDGKTYIIQANSSMQKFDDGSMFILSTMLDVTNQSELTDMIREERSQYRDALLTNCEYAFSLDLTEGNITDGFVTKHGVNPFMRLGIEPPVPYDEFMKKWIEGLKPKFLNDNMASDMSRDSMLEKFARGERTSEVEYYSPLTDIYTRVTSLLSRSERNGHIMAVIVATDTTRTRREEARTKQALMDAYEAARRANAAKSDFLSRMSHDIRTPMNAIIGMTAIAGTHLDDKERVADCLNKITVSSGHLLSLINEVLDMSKIESGKVDLNEEDFNLSDLVDALIAMVRPQIKLKEQNLKVNINDVVHEKVIGDKLRIQQSFLNFMSNAVKYTPNGGSINLYISEKNSHSPRVGKYEFVFEDTGIGMSEEFVKHIFEPFSRALDSRVSKEQGTGLGLAIADNLVHMMNGNIKVESELGKGSRFTVTIMLKLQDTEELSYSEFANLPVLFADDDEATCENACRMLDELGMKGEWVLDGRAAVDKVVERHKAGSDYFSVILDWKMPGMDGIEATREIRRLVGPDVPIIIISAYDWSDIELEARAAGADAFIGKPLFKSRLAHLFHDMMSGSEEKDIDNDVDSLKKENFSGKRVLLVEDNELNAEIAQELLEMTGLEVELAENGQIAADKFAASDYGYYQMIFMDIQMPVMNGNEAARAIRALPRKDAKGIPIVAMTANAFSEDVQASLSAGMNEHIPKPLDLKQLVKTLSRWLS